jgi:gas vesicle protein
LICAVIISFRARSTISSQTEQANMPVSRPLTAYPAPEVTVAPSIEDVKGRQDAEIIASKKDPVSLSQVYAQYPKEDVGKNMVASWAMVSQKEKEKVFEQLDKQIEQSMEAIKVNPEDSQARQILFIAETLKSMCKNNFDFNLIETVSQDQGSANSISKK